MSHLVDQPAPKALSRRGSRLLYVRITLRSGPLLMIGASTAAVVRLPTCGSNSCSLLTYGAPPILDVTPGCGTEVSRLTKSVGTTDPLVSLTNAFHLYALLQDSRPLGTV